MRQFASTWSNLLKNCISANFLLLVALVQSALRNELFVAPFVERINTVIDFGKVLMRDFTSTWSNLLTLYFCRFFADSSLSTKYSTEGAVYGSFRREL